eukprot:SAG25_NODE_1424_length_3059_cov_1.477365_2_plen_66_part_00
MLRQHGRRDFVVARPGVCDHAHIAIEAAKYIHVNYNTYLMSLLHFCDYAGFQQPQMYQYCKELGD